MVKKAITMAVGGTCATGALVLAGTGVHAVKTHAAKAPSGPSCSPARRPLR